MDRNLHVRAGLGRSLCRLRTDTLLVVCSQACSGLCNCLTSCCVLVAEDAVEIVQTHTDGSSKTPTPRM